MQAQPTVYPAGADLTGPHEIARWRPLVHWFLAIPQMFIAGALETVRGILQIIAFFTVLFTKSVPRPLFDMIVMTLRYEWRVYSYVFFMRESYPPFDFQPASEDNGVDPASLQVEYPTELRRFMPLVKWFLAIPHYIVLFFLVIGFFFALLFAFFAVLFTGRFPEGVRNYGVGIARWVTRVTAYVGFLRDEYPPFSLT